MKIEVENPIKERGSKSSLTERLNPSEKKKVHKSQKFLLNLQLLLRKNFLVQKRSVKSLSIQLFSPIVICILLYILQLSANSVVGQAVEEPPIVSLEPIPQCYFNYFDPQNCSTITYGVIVILFFLF